MAFENQYPKKYMYMYNFPKRRLTIGFIKRNGYYPSFDTIRKYFYVMPLPCDTQGQEQIPVVANWAPFQIALLPFILSSNYFITHAYLFLVLLVVGSISFGFSLSSSSNSSAISNSELNGN